MSEYWFRAKTHGYGATPANWKGWAAVLVTVAVTSVATAVLIVSPQISGTPPAPAQVAVWAAIVAVTVAGLVVLSRAKTEGEWKWRWGDKD